MLIKLSNLLLLLFTSFILSAQCPSATTLSTNNNCFYLSWPTGSVPSPLPATMVFNGITFNLSSGAGTAASPAIYSNGNCPNSTPNAFTGTITINGQSCHYASGILPVVYDNYKITKDALSTTVIWTTYSEINVSKYNIYMSFDAEDWTLVNSLYSQGNTQHEIAYSSKLNVSKHQPVFYIRVDEEDMDGTIHQFDVLEARNPDYQSLNFYPNPAHDLLYFDNDDHSIVSIKDFSNREMISQIAIRDKALDISKLPEGLYFVSINNGISTDIVKVLKY